MEGVFAYRCLLIVCKVGVLDQAEKIVHELFVLPQTVSDMISEILDAIVVHD